MAFKEIDLCKLQYLDIERRKSSTLSQYMSYMINHLQMYLKAFYQFQGLSKVQYGRTSSLPTGREDSTTSEIYLAKRLDVCTGVQP